MNVTRWFNNGTNIPQHAIDRIINHLTRVRRHECLGVLAIEVGYSLSQTIAIVQHMCSAGLLRQLTDDEKRNLGLDPIIEVYAIIKQTTKSQL